MRTYHLDDTERMIQNVLGNRREITVHGSSAFPCASYLDYYKKSAYPWHWHDEMEIAYIQEGEAEATIDGRKYRLLEGDGYFANCRVLHAVAGVGEEEMRMPNILFHPSLLYGTRDSVFWGKYMEPLVMSPGVSHVILRAEVPWQKDILELTAESFALMTRENYGYEFRVRDRLSEIMLLFCEHREELPAVPGNAESRTHQEMERVRTMLAFIQTHYHKPLQLAQIADSASVSRRECLRLFRRLLDTSPMQYVTELRIGQAKRLLAETGLPLLAVANRCGFSDESYFIKVFRERTGSTPARFRKQRGREEKRHESTAEVESG